jgi:hypothetical protein
MLLRVSPKAMTKKHRPGQVVPKDGVYRVTHDKHRLMHLVTLLEGSRFPACRRCGPALRFEMLRALQNPTHITSGYHSILEDYPQDQPLTKKRSA